MVRPAATVLSLVLGWSGTVAGSANARIFFLDLRGKLVSASPDGSNRQVVIEGPKGQPDGQGVLTGIAHADLSRTTTTRRR